MMDKAYASSYRTANTAYHPSYVSSLTIAIWLSTRFSDGSDGMTCGLMLFCARKT